MSDTQKQRQNQLLRIFAREQAMSLQELRLKIGVVSDATLKRDLHVLQNNGMVVSIGKNKNTRYQLTHRGLFFQPLDAHYYCGLDIDTRGGRKDYYFDIWDTIPHDIFSEENRSVCNNATKIFIQKSQGASAVLREKELERFVIELSWKSSKIEGNTYTLLDTELLIREGREAPLHTKSEAVMILNHKDAFKYILEHISYFKIISRKNIEEIHSLLVHGLPISKGFRKGIVGITGSTYKPLSVPSQIEEAIKNLCDVVEKISDSYTKAFIVLLGMSYIQPFEDGNKRTARLLANAILLAYDKAPLSYRNVDEILYRESMLTFYETLSLTALRDTFLEQYLFSCEEYMKLT